MPQARVDADPQGSERSLLALLPSAGPDIAAVREAGAEHLVHVVTDSLGDFLARLRSGRWTATLVSLSVDHVDERVVASVAREPGSGTLLLSAPGASLQRALLAERVGAAGILREPIDAEDLRRRLELLDDEGEEVPFPELDAVEDTGDGLPPLVGESAAMARIVEHIARVSRSDSTVLVAGESGTGKEVVARALHAASPRASRPFVPVNCAAIPEQLLESELFGHQRGAFTGAIASRTGRFAQADGGSLLLDEIGDMSLVLQSKLLRTLEDRTVEPVGGTGAQRIDVRVIAATHRDLRAAVDEGRFREDLYYRLSVVEIPLPPLRERSSDVRNLALYFGRIFARKHGRDVRAISERALGAMEVHRWPGNVRELRNVMDRAVLLANGPVLRTGHLRLGEAAPRSSSRLSSRDPRGYPTNFTLEQVEADHIARVLSELDGQIGQASEVLGIHRNTLRRKIQQYGIDADGSSSQT